jgi:light-regulated signal transduction histidine kinase (bacteriophytochrome)
MILTGTGKAQMNHLRQIADRMEAEEHRLLVERTITAKSSASRSRYTLALASGIDFLLIVLMFRYFVRERHMRVASELDAERIAVARAEADERADEVRALNATLEERVRLRTSELETINHELESFSYSVSHDLRAPLRTIDGFSLALEEDYASVVDAAGKDYIRRVRNGVQRMGQLIDALLQLSRITRAEITRDQFDISQMAESIASDLRQENPGKDLTFHIENGLKVFADPRLLQVALENLLGNAVKFSSKISAPVINFGWDPMQRAWYVRDNGAGFDMFYADKLFNAFNRLHGDKDFKGSGIGLATVARVVHRHHGRIWADSTVDHGATFWFTLG